MDYEAISKILKAMADPKRMKIIDLLSCGSMCACDVLKHFEFTQPTLSHHMKVLETAGIISVNKSGQWHHYSLKPEFTAEFLPVMQNLLKSDSDTCICQDEQQ